MIPQRLMLAATLLLAATAHAQYKVSEVVAKGGQVMNAQQIRAELGGATVSGTTENGFQFELKLATDGKIEGMVHGPRNSSGAAGTWTVNARNQLCTDISYTIWRNTVQRCVWYWKAGEEYFSTNSRLDDDASARFVDCLLSGGKECDGSFSVAKRSVRK